MKNEIPNIYNFEAPIRAFVTKRLIAVDTDSTVQEAARKMVEFNISSMVVTKNNKVTGFFTDFDIKKKIVSEGRRLDTPVSEIMTKELVTADIGTTVKEVLRILSKKNIKHILVTEKDEIIGIMTFRDLIDIDRHSLETYIARD